jgi:hypothetical protein
MKNQSQICWAPTLQTFTIKFSFTFLFVLLSLQRVLGQFQDDFSDHDFTTAPSWSGSNSFFIVEGSQLKLQAPEEDGLAFLSTPSQALNDAVWEFKVTLEFNPSASNFAKIYLASDQEDLSTALNGYFVIVGDSKDEISLYQQHGINSSKIIDGRDGILNLSAPNVKIKITRSKNGSWKLFSDIGVTGNYEEEGSAEHNLTFSSQYFGILCKYTATRSSKFYFDDFKVEGEPSENITIPPVIPSNFKDIVITEVLADPSPSIGLPEIEFVEIYNRTDQVVNLSGWRFGDSGSSSELPFITLQPKSYLILTSSGTGFSNSAVSLSNFPSLNNASDAIVLRDPRGIVVDSVNYFDAWYDDDDKKNGGWSLELIDPNNVCSESQNWTASESPNGGTPGEQNSVFAEKPDLTGPKLASIAAINSENIVLIFDEKLEENLPALTAFTISPPTPLANVSFSDASLTSLQIQLQGSLEKSVFYAMKVNQVYDCTGNELQEEYSSLTFGLIEKADSLDVVFNEILFNPRPTGVDFIEVVNRSSKFINLKNWSIATVDDDGQLKDQAVISKKDVLVNPGAYMALTENPGLVKSEYIQANESSFLLVDNLPGFNDDAGSVVLLDEEGKTIDFISYHKEMHSVFIKDDEGVSLERISVNAFADQDASWKSASATVGFATPGYINSNTIPETQSEDPLAIVPEIFDPLSSQPDFATIEYNFDKAGYVANIKIFNPQGHLIKQIASNEILSTTGFYRWDGDRDDGSKASVGYYMVWLEIFDDSGNVKKFQKRVAIAAQF